MKPSEKIKNARRLPVLICVVTGIDPFNVKLYPRFVLVLLLLCTYTAMYLNGCYQSLDDPFKFIHALAPIAIIITLAARILNLYLRNWLDFDPLMSKLTFQLYEKYENDPKYRKILAKRAAETDFFMKFLTISSFLFFHLPILTTVFAYMLTGQKVLFLNNYLPYTDPTKTLHFFLNFGIHMFLLPMAFCGIMFTDILFVMYGYHIVTMCDMMCCHLDEVAKDLIVLKVETVKMLKSIKGTFHQVMMREMQVRNVHDEMLQKLEQRFIDIIMEHKTFEKYLRDFCYFIEINYIFQILCNSISIGMCIVVFFKVSMLLGVSGSLIFISLVVTPCIMGTLISYQNDRLAKHLIDFPWFDMSRSKQKVFMQFVHAVQNTTEFQLPIFGTVIDCEAFTEILNASYSYFTLFWSMVDH